MSVFRDAEVTFMTCALDFCDWSGNERFPYIVGLPVFKIKINLQIPENETSSERHAQKSHAALNTKLVAQPTVYLGSEPPRAGSGPLTR